MRPVDVKSSTYIDFDIESNVKNHKFKIVDHVITSKYQNVFAKRHVPN